MASKWGNFQMASYHNLGYKAIHIHPMKDGIARLKLLYTEIFDRKNGSIFVTGRAMDYDSVHQNDHMLQTVEEENWKP